MRRILVALLVLTVGGAGARADVAPDGIYVVSSTGGPSRLLAADGFQPALSPDGRLVAYASPQLRLMNANGSDPRPVGTAWGERPQWSPDGQTLVYTGQNSDLCYPGPAQRCVVGELWRVNADGSGMQKVRYSTNHPVWSPDGRRLLFRDFIVGEVGQLVGGVHVSWADGSHVRTLARGQAIDGVRSLPTWSPDGKWVAFNVWRVEQFHLFVIRSDGSHVRQLKNATGATFPSWSPDGKLIAFERGHGVWVIPATGGGARRISTGADCPTWSPRGKRLAFLTEGSAARLVVVERNGHGRKALAPAADCYSRGWAEPSPPAWSRDGRRIYFAR